MRFRRGGLPGRRILTAALAALAILLYWAHVGDRGAREPARPPAVEDQARAWGSSVGFADRRRLEEHFEKHGREVGASDRQDYLRMAQALRDARPGGDILEAVRRDGVTTRFDRASGLFVAFNRDGTIRTCFRPNDGERYFRRQAERGE